MLSNLFCFEFESECHSWKQAFAECCLGLIQLLNFVTQPTCLWTLWLNNLFLHGKVWIYQSADAQATAKQSVVLDQKCSAIWHCLFFKICKEKKDISIMMLRKALFLHDWWKSQWDDPLWSTAGNSGAVVQVLVHKSSSDVQQPLHASHGCSCLKSE